MNRYKVFFGDEELLVEANSIRGAQVKVVGQGSIETETDLFVVLVEKNTQGVDLVGC